MSRPFPLSAVKAGMTRLLDKGGASRDSLYDLCNGYVDAARRSRIRPGHTVDNDALDGTFGLIGWRDEQWVFADHDVTVGTGYRLAIITHPTDPSLELVDIPFVGPITGALYVVGKFSDGSTYHYFLEEGAEWSPETAYSADSSLVIPTAANGYYYRPERLIDEYPAWSAGAIRQVGDRIEPTVENGFYYEVVSVEGTNPASGATEPTWPTNDGQTVSEDTASGTASGVTPPVPAPGTGGGGEVGCVVDSSWLSPELRASDVMVGTLSDLHDPGLGFHRGQCTAAAPSRLLPCVRITTSSGAELEMSTTTPINFATATHDMQEGHWAMAPEVLGKPVLVEDDIEIVVSVLHIGMKFVRPLSFENGRSFAASRMRAGRRIYTHNIAKHDEY